MKTTEEVIADAKAETVRFHDLIDAWDALTTEQQAELVTYARQKANLKETA